MQTFNYNPFDKDGDEILSLETASFKHKINKPLRFEQISAHQKSPLKLEQRPDSTKSCALKQSETLFGDHESEQVN